MAINLHALYSQRLATSHIGDLPDTGSITVFDFGISSKLCPFGKNLSKFGLKEGEFDQFKNCMYLITVVILDGYGRRSEQPGLF